MTGGAYLRNKNMAGAKSEWNESIATTVPKSSLSWSKGGEAWKGLIGRRIYTPSSLLMIGNNYLKQLAFGARPRAREPLSTLFLPVVLVVSYLKTHG